MTEEEKKAIELVKDFLEQSIINKSDDDFFKSGGWETIDMEYSKAVKVIFELVEKQQKEIEKYKELLNLNIGVDLSYDDYISKEAIRENIEELESYIYKGENGPQDFLQYRVKAKIQGYKELLGE